MKSNLNGESQQKRLRTKILQDWARKEETVWAKQEQGGRKQEILSPEEIGRG